MMQDGLPWRAVLALLSRPELLHPPDKRMSMSRPLVASPWEGHCYPPKFQQLQRTAWQKHMARGP
jgi:hypothetical protein